MAKLQAATDISSRAKFVPRTANENENISICLYVFLEGGPKINFKDWKICLKLKKKKKIRSISAVCHFPEYPGSEVIIFGKVEAKLLGEYLRISAAKTVMLSQAVSSLSKGFVVLIKPSSGLIVKNLSRSV